MQSEYMKHFVNRVVDLSEADNWEESVKEWKISGCDEDEFAMTSCICGKENIRYLYTIKNVKNGHQLSPIGSQCIKKFKRTDLNQVTSLYERLFKLYHASQNNEFIVLSSEFFTKRLLEYLHNQGAFVPNQYNNYNGDADYQFILKMFNKRNKTSITAKQKSKIRAVILTSILPAVKREIEGRQSN